MGHADAVIERERKYRISDEEATRLEARLRVGGRPIRIETQENVVLRDRATRLRKGTYLRLRTSASGREITFKGKKSSNGLDKSRLELTVSIGDGPLLELLDAIGLEPQIRYVKETAIWSLGGVLVSLDHIEGLGRFCELEAQVEDADLDAAARSLGLREESWEPRGYRTLVGARSYAS